MSRQRHTPCRRLVWTCTRRIWHVNVGCGQSVSVNDLWERIRELSGVPVLPRYAEGRPSEVRESLASIDKARAFVEYQPVVDFLEGLRQTVAYYRHHRKAGRRRRPRTVARVA